MKRISILLISMLACAVALAQFRPADGFQVQAYVVRGSEIFNTWNRADGPPIETVMDGRRGEELYVMILFKGAQRDASGIARVKFDMALVKPSGQRVGPFEMTAGEGAMPDEVQQNWYLSNTRPGLRSLLTEAGEYTVVLTIKDQIGSENKPFEIKFPIAQ
jgi:hypothetical protein